MRKSGKTTWQTWARCANLRVWKLHDSDAFPCQCHLQAQMRRFTLLWAGPVPTCFVCKTDLKPADQSSSISSVSLSRPPCPMAASSSQAPSSSSSPASSSSPSSSPSSSVTAAMGPQCPSAGNHVTPSSPESARRRGRNAAGTRQKNGRKTADAAAPFARHRAFNAILLSSSPLNRFFIALGIALGGPLRWTRLRLACIAALRR